MSWRAEKATGLVDRTSTTGVVIGTDEPAGTLVMGSLAATD
jgi:hypothetical protein